MAVTLVTITWDELDIGSAGVSGSVRFTLSQALEDTTTGAIYEPGARSFPIVNGVGQSVPLVPNDSDELTPDDTYYTIIIAVSGQPPRSMLKLINADLGTTQALGELPAAVPLADAPLAMPLAGGQFTGGVGPGLRTLTGAATVTIDAALANDVTLTLTQNTLLATPLNPKPGQRLLVQAIQGGGGGWVLSYSAGFAFLPNPDAPSPVLGTAPGSRNYLLFRYDAGLAQWVLLSFL